MTLTRACQRLLGTATALALVGVFVAFGGPAAAAVAAPQVNLVGNGFCQEWVGQPIVMWTVSQNSGYVGTFVGLQAAPAGSTLSSDFVKIVSAAAGPMSGTQFVPGGTTTASLTVSVQFDLPEGPTVVTATGTASVPSCSLIRPSATFAKQCDGSVNVVIRHPSTSSRQAVVTVTGVETVWLNPGAEATVTVPSWWADNIQVEYVRIVIASTGPLAVPASCSGGSIEPPPAVEQPGPGGQQPGPGVEQPVPATTGNGPSGPTGSVPARPAPDGTGPMETSAASEPAQSTSSAGAMTDSVQRTADDPSGPAVPERGVRLASSAQRQAPVISGFVAAIIGSAIVVIVFRWRRRRLPSVGAEPVDTATSDEA